MISIFFVLFFNIFREKELLTMSWIDSVSAVLKIKVVA